MSSRKKAFLYLVMIMAVFTTSCEPESESPSPDPENQIIVEAYVFANEPVDHVKVTKIGQGSESSIIPVSDAQVVLSQGSSSVALSPTEGSPGFYHIPDSNTVFSGSEMLSLKVVVNGYTYQSQTKFPPAIGNLTISNNYINLNSFLPTQIVASLTWDPAPGAMAYGLFIKKHQADTIYQLPEADDASDGPLYSIHTESGVELLAEHFDHLGNYHLYVSAVNDEYIEMHGGEGSAELRGGPSNITGGWGIFTAFNGSEVQITVE